VCAHDAPNPADFSCDSFVALRLRR
jgi:hypothetical protein